MRDSIPPSSTFVIPSPLSISLFLLNQTTGYCRKYYLLASNAHCYRFFPYAEMVFFSLEACAL